MIRLAHSLHRNERGAAVIELALVAPILRNALIGVVELCNGYAASFSSSKVAQRDVERCMNTSARRRKLARTRSVPGQNTKRPPRPASATSAVTIK